jgi:hypothetical protein
MLATFSEADRRRALRHRVDYPVLGERPRRGDVRLRILNISTRGFMAAIEAGLAPGERLTLGLPVIGRIEAHVLWTDGPRAGLQFERVVRLGDFTRMFVEMQPRRRFRDWDPD